ncbi:conserved hypothetical protein [Leishmania mexicana MHOM/GT/2001/U1103]|uniref:Uncharacterized protein n=1 Tax=Leishmania mexicana (strain MHOM/GT/2001/U1103) TaxID=929439 RepID=E9B589_LEIMU|nr:conserved hypothetical protein [Leishmania mexicana MHOM/GT/2001/U1103]CBZ30409.1 conserved hypothetical protein [Leishmania mexicana MHOM/GT/2001/U1103]
MRSGTCTPYTLTQGTPGAFVYQNVSRSVSPSVQSRRVPRVVDLETIEELQDAWSRQYETLRDPPPPPLLNSPRSLRACELANVSPQSTLQKLSLKQHLFCVLGNPQALSSLPDWATTEYQVLIQSALRSFSEAAVGLGTSQEKLAAFIAFTNQEKLRVPQLASLRALRRQLMAQEAITERGFHHQQPDYELSKCISSASATYQDASDQGAHLSDLREVNLLCASKIEKSLPPSNTSSLSHRRGDGTTGTEKTRFQSPRYSPLESASFAQAETGNDEYDEGVRGCGAWDFAPTPTPSGKLPYKPRDVYLLNSSYFANRSIRSDRSNPSGAPLPASSPGTPSPLWGDTMTATGFAKLPAPSPQPLLTVDASLGTVIDVDSEFSLACEAEDTAESRSAPKQDLSIVSMNSSQLELLNIAESTASSSEAALAQPSAAAVLAVIRGKVKDGSLSKHTVTLFHESNERRSRGDAAATAAEVGVAPSTASIAERKPGPFSQPLPQRGLRGYTNHGNFASLLVPNVLARPVSPPAEGKVAPFSLGVAAAATSPFGKDKAVASKQQEGMTSTTATPIECTDSAEPAAASAPWRLPSPPVITQAEESDGFVYYCANPSHSVINSYAGRREFLAVTVKL